jgi:hypothetical protein
MERIQQEIRLLQRSSEDSANVSDKLNKEVSRKKSGDEVCGVLSYQLMQLT